MGQQGPWSEHYVKIKKLMINFFSKPDFSGFLICVINGPGVPFGQVANLLEFIPHHMTASSLHVSISKLLINLNIRKHLIVYPFDHDLWVPLYTSW